MPVDYKNNNGWEALLLVLDEHCQWFHNVIEYLFYAHLDNPSKNIVKPSSFAQWILHAKEDDTVQLEIIEKLTAVHNELFKISDQLVNAMEDTGNRPSHASYKNFVTIFEEFISHIRRLEKNFISESRGYDPFTGLRNKKMLKDDVRRELHRLARQGRNFCLAIASIDNFDSIRNTAHKDEVDGYIKLVASLIKLSIRSFDDAYYMGNDEFVLCLKQADLSGGIAALERLRRELERQKITLDPIRSNYQNPLSMSCCIAEPVDGDDVDELLNNLRNDLKNTDKDSNDTVLKYRELSPLQRFVREGV